MRKNIIYCLILLFLISSVSAATLHGEIYDLELEKVGDVLVEINTVPKQQYLAKAGEYSFEVPLGEYILKAHKDELAAEEKIKVVGEGEFIFDLFLFPSFDEEDEFLSELEGIEAEEEKEGLAKYPLWSYLTALGIFLILIGRAVLARRKYKRLKEKQKLKEDKEEAAEKKETGVGLEKEYEEEPDHLEEALKIITKYDGRISQKELRKEMMYLSEAKISLILTELEHKGRIEKIKKGRGNVVILRKHD